MIDFVLFLGAALSPSFTYANEERGNYEADVFRVDQDGGPQATVEDLIREEPDTSDREVLSIQPGPDDDKITITLLNGNDGQVKTAYFYRMDLPREENSWICASCRSGFRSITVQWVGLLAGGRQSAPNGSEWVEFGTAALGSNHLKSNSFHCATLIRCRRTEDDLSQHGAGRR